MLRSFKLNGNMLDQGSAKAYLEFEDELYLIFDSERLDEDGVLDITGLVVADIDESEISGGGIKTFDEIFEFNVVDEFSDGLNSEKLCTKWSVNDVSLCYGAEDCCALFDLESSGLWNSSLYLSYGRHNSELENIIKAQLVYADYSLDVEDPYSDIIYSDVMETTAEFYEKPILLEDSCIDTCLLPDFNSSSYKLVFIVDNTTLTIDSISYSVKKDINISENIPEQIKEFDNLTIYKNEIMKVNLSSYFSDYEELSYSVYTMENIGVVIDGDIATLIPFYNYTGKEYTFFSAYDGYYNVSSNLFNVKVIEKPFKQDEVDVSERLVKSSVVINEPVRWVKYVNVSDNVINLNINIPSDALNVSVRDVKENKIVSSDKVKVNDSGVIKDSFAFGAEKRLIQIENIENELEEKKVDIIIGEPTSKDEVGSINRELLGLQNERNQLTGYVVGSKGKGLLTRFFEWLSKTEITGYVVMEELYSSDCSIEVEPKKLKLIDSSCNPIKKVKVKLKKENNGNIKNKKTGADGIVDFSDYSGKKIPSKFGVTYKGATYITADGSYDTGEILQTKKYSLKLVDSYLNPIKKASVKLKKVNGKNAASAKTNNSGVASFEVVPNAQMKFEINYKKVKYTTDLINVSVNMQVNVQKIGKGYLVLTVEEEIIPEEESVENETEETEEETIEEVEAINIVIPKSIIEINETIEEEVQNETVEEAEQVEEVEEEVTPEEDIIEIIIEDIVSDVEIEYYTEAPSSVEEIIDDFNKKITISSDINYTDISAFSYLSLETDKVKLYWVNESRYINFSSNDTNNNGLIDYISWIVPHLSSQSYIIEDSGSNTTLVIWDETDVGNKFGDKVRYPKNITYFFANYSNRTSGKTINDSGVFCNISFIDLTSNMTFDVTNRLYSYNRTFTYAGNYSFNITCDGSAIGYSLLNTSDNVTITQPVAGFSATSLSNPGTSTSLVWADYDNDEDWDLVYTGTSNEYFYKNNDGILTSDSAYSFNSIKDGSMGFADVDNDGDLDLVAIGNSGSRTSTVYLNNGSAFNSFQSLTGVDLASLNLFDLNKDGKIDITLMGKSPSRKFLFYQNNGTFFSATSGTGSNVGSLNTIATDDIRYILATGLTGVAASSAIAKTYTFDNFNLVEQQNLSVRYYSSTAVADFDNDGDLDLVIGGSYTADAVYLTDYSKWNGTAFDWSQNLTGLRDGSFSVGDINNDGKIDLITAGFNGTNFVKVYLNNGSSLIDKGNYSISSINSGAANEGSIALFDYDNDGDLDLAVSGNNIAEIYNNNISLSTSNQVPSSPNSTITLMDGDWLNISWNNGTDDLTPVLGLYYNIKVGTKPDYNDVVSGKYGGSSNPTQSYLGNMMQAKKYSVNVTENRTYFWQVQSIDTGLKSSNWSSIQQYDPCPAPSASDWNITVNCVRYNETIIIAEDKNINIKNNVTLTLIDSTLLFNQTSDGNSGLYVIEGGINISNSNISSVNSYDYSFFVYNNSNISMIDSYLSNVGFANNYMQRGLEINGTIVSFRNNILQDNYIGITLYSDNNKIIDSVVNGTFRDVSSVNSDNNTLLNITFTTKSVSGSTLNVRYYLDVTVTGNGSTVSGATVEGYNSSNVLIDTKTSGGNGIAKLELTQYVDSNGVENSYNPYTITITSDRYITKSEAFTLNGNGETTINLTLSGEPYWSDFKNSLTTNFTNISSWSNLGNVTIGNPNKGRINFTENVTVAGLNLSAAITISNNFISLDSTSYTGLNKSAVLSIYNVSYNFTPVILRDNVVCDSTICTGITYTNYNNLTFNVTGFTSYSSASNSKLAVTSSNRYNNKLLVNETVWFTANYTNRTSGVSINYSGTNCSILFNDTAEINMTFNASTLVYDYNRTFNSTGEWDYNISCKGILAGYENINATTVLTTYLNVTYLALNQSLEGISYGASLVLGNLNSDNYSDIIISGETTSSSSSAVTYWYSNNESIFNLTYSGLIYNISRSSISLNDYDKDSDLDIFISGYDGQSLEPRFLIIKNN